MDSAVTTSSDAPQAAVRAFDPIEIRRRYASAFRPNPWIYWSDLLVSAGIGWGAFAMALAAPFASLGYFGWLGVSIVALLRAALFIHELTHLRPGALPGFEAGWHLLAGLPLMLPSLMYVGSHNDHHKKNVFGTRHDPEYAPIARWSRLRLVRFVLEVALVPLALPLRWGVLAPLSYLIPALRKPVVERLSTLFINADYRRPMPRGTQARRWAIQEAAACVLFWVVAGLLWQGVLPLTLVVTWVLLTSGILVINQIRTLAAHRYECDGREVDATAQLMDSINLRGVPVLTALIAPVGLRYHALHHFLPTVPYHSLGTLHRRLLRELPSEAEYHRTEAGGILAAVRELWERAPA